MKRLALLPALALLVACEQPTAPASSELELQPSFGVTLNVQIPLTQFAFVSCALGGDGEQVRLEGFLHVLIGSTVDKAGGIHSFVHYQPMGITGTGLTSGNTYHGVGLSRGTVNGVTFPFNETWIDNFYIIGEEPGAKYKVHTTYHVTINANGEVTASVDNSWVTCG